MPNRSIFHSNEEDTTLGGRISMARETSGLSVDQVVKRLGVKATTYEAWEADRSEPRAQQACCACRYFKHFATLFTQRIGQTTEQARPPRTAN